jgi:hypothetical protein
MCGYLLSKKLDWCVGEESPDFRPMRSIGSSKIQVPRYKEIPNFKDQTSEDFFLWILVIEDCELFVSCDLVIGYSTATQWQG